MQKMPTILKSRKVLIFLIIFSFLSGLQAQTNSAENNKEKTFSPLDGVLIPYSIHKKDIIDYQSKPPKHYIDILEIGLQKDGNLSMRLKAASILGRYRSKESIELLHKTLATTAHPSLRSQCIDALARINDDLSVIIIENALKEKGYGGEIDGKPFVKNGLEMIDAAYKKNPKSIIQYPKSEEYLNVLITSAWALGYMGRNRSINVLAEVMNHPNEKVQVNAAYALGEIANPGQVLGKKASAVDDHIEEIIKKFSDEKTPVKVRIALAFPMLKLRKNERKGFYYLAKSLLNEDDFIRALAAKVLSRLHDIRGLSPLEDAITRERSPWVEDEMAQAIKQIKIFNQSYR